MLGMNQSQLGDLAGIGFEQVQDYETGGNSISISRMWDIANVLDVPVAFFFEGLDGQTADPGEPWGEISTDKEASEFVLIYYSIPENQRKRLFDLACTLGAAS